MHLIMKIHEGDEGNFEDRKNASDKKQEIEKESSTEEAPTGIASAATPEVETNSESDTSSSLHDEEVDKW